MAGTAEAGGRIEGWNMLQDPVEAEIKDAFDGQLVKITIDQGRVTAAEPTTAVAWAVEKKRPQDKIALSGNFQDRTG